MRQFRSASGSSVAEVLAGWAYALEPTPEDFALAQRSLLDTVAVALAARWHPLTRLASELGDGAQWAVAGHVLDFDDLHLESTAHVSVVCVPAVLAAGGDATAYLAAAGVMSRLGTALGWAHYSAGWHATCTAGAPAAAAGAAVAMGLGPRQIATAMALAVPGAGGVQRAFGTDAKALQVGFAVETGLRAARLAAAGVDADLTAMDAWLRLVGGSHERLKLAGPAVPGGLAIKMYPACYALQRPISAIAALVREGLDPASVKRAVLRAPEASFVPLIHHRPRTGLQAKFSIEYAVATALLDTHQGFESFTDTAVGRPAARRLTELVVIELEPGGAGLLDGELIVEMHLADGDVVRTAIRNPPGSPQRPPTEGEFAAKIADCVTGLEPTSLADPAGWTWTGAADALHAAL